VTLFLVSVVCVMASPLLLLLACALVGINAEIDLCLDFSTVIAPVQAASALGPDILVLGYTASDLAQTVSVFQYMETALQVQSSPHVSDLYVGFGNNNFYMIIRCKFYTGGAPCSSNPEGYIYEMRNDAINGPSSPYYGTRVHFLSLAG
jgi:hypothetical protein